MAIAYNLVDKRLAGIRMQTAKHAAAGIDTGSWESTFFLQLLDEKNKEIKKLNTANRRLSELVVRLNEDADSLRSRVRATRL